MIEQLPDVLSALVNDGFTFGELQGGGIAGVAIGAVLTRLLRKRAETARELLLTELRRGEKPLTAPEVEEAVAVVYRYFRAAQEGAARLNLRLMAKVIAGQSHLGRLTASEFMADAEMLASLKYQEVVLLGTMYHAWTADWFQEQDPRVRLGALYEWVGTKLVPAVFRDIEELRATAGAITRTGLLKPEPTLGFTVFSPTPLLDRLNSLVPLEAAIREEDGAS